MLSLEEAQGLTDACCAVALAAGVVARLRGGTSTPIDRRLIFVFGGLALFFAFRAPAILLDSGALRTMAQLMVAPLMLAGLVLAEGVLRRHAPWWLKACITGGGALVCAVLLLFGRSAPITHPAWGIYVTLSLLAMTVLVFTRDRASLSPQENANVDSLLWALGALTLLAVTDFVDISPLGMSGIGAALLALLARYNTTSQRGVRQSIAEVGVIVVIAALFTLALAQALHMQAARETIRLGITILALLIALTMVLAALRDRVGRDDARALRRALAGADLSSLTAFLDSLVGHPLLRGLLLAEGALLSEYDPVALCETLKTRAVWRRRAFGEEDALANLRGRDELEDLMSRTESSHAALVSAEPVRIALLTLPDVSSADEAEIDLALFCKLAVVAAGGRA